MHKIDLKYENPIDRFLYLFVEKHSLQLEFLTPNQITTISVVFKLAAIYFFVKFEYKLAALAFFISYFYDCVDGYHARRLKMTSVFGDYYDHISDVVAHFIFFILILKDLEGINRIVIGLILIVLQFLMINHLGYQENICKSDSSTLKICSIICNKICKKDPKEMIKYTKYFGCGTYMIIILFIIAFFNKVKVFDQGWVK